jgi:hypothetical protein
VKGNNMTTTTQHTGVDMTRYTDEEVVRCIELCEELLGQLVARANTTRRRLNKLNIERARRDLQAAVDAGKETE